MKQYIYTSLFALACIGPLSSSSQAPNQQAELTLPDAPSPSADSVASAAAQRETTWRTLPGNFLEDQKGIWLFPVQLAKGHHWVPTLVIAGGTAAFIAADPHVASYFRSHQKNVDKLNDVFDPMITTGEVIALPTSLLVAGYIRHEQREVSTALMAAEAYGDSAIVDLAIKAITRRQRPSDIPAGQPFANTFFNGSKSPFKGSSFPSGHSAAAFSVATVVADRYSRKRWVPVLSYMLATAISASRVSENAHFTSDVFLGAALGYTTAKYTVLRPR
jgi:membrane-associated phospholipid phosphatase